MRFQHKLVYSILLDIVFTFLIILVLVVNRNMTANYLIEIEDYSTDIQQIKESLGDTYLQDLDIQAANEKINYVEGITKKALMLNYVIFPLVVLILFLLFQVIYWKINTNGKVIFSLLFGLASILLLFILILSLLDYVDYLYFNAGNSLSLIILIIALMSILIINYFSYTFTRKESFKKNISFGLKELKNLILQYFGISLTNLIYLFLIGVIFVLTYIEYSIVLPSILLFLIIILINIQKYYFIKKINTLK